MTDRLYPLPSGYIPDAESLATSFPEDAAHFIKVFRGKVKNVSQPYLDFVDVVMLSDSTNWATIEIAFCKYFLRNANIIFSIFAKCKLSLKVSEFQALLFSDVNCFS